MNALFRLGLAVLGAYLLLRWLRIKWIELQSEGHQRGFFTVKRHPYFVTLSLLLLVPLISINWIVPEVSAFVYPDTRSSIITVSGIIIAFSISAIWLLYIRKLDIYETEPWGPIVSTFLMSCATIWLVFPLSAWINHSFSFVLNGDPLNDFMYCFITIGMVEELVKIVPVLVILYTTKHINEPYDYILYGSVSALGFAFVENIMYITRSDLFAINGRLLMASVAHMTFTSVIAYSIMLVRFKFRKNFAFYLFGGFVMASFMHGFYDFWLINPTAQQFALLSVLFFIITIHIWYTMKNNAINVSNFFNKQYLLENDKLKYFLVLALTGIFMLSVVMIALVHGRSEAQTFFTSQMMYYGYFIFYLAFSFSQFRIRKGFIAPFQIPFNLFVPGVFKKEEKNRG